MRTFRLAGAGLGVLLPAPLALTLVEATRFYATCAYDCGDMGGRGLFLLMLLCTPPAAVGLAMLPTTGAGGLRRLAYRLVVAVVLLCTLTLAGFAVAADVGAIKRLTGRTPDDTQSDGVMAGVAVVLTAMSVAAVLALGAAWRRRR